MIALRFDGSDAQLAQVDEPAALPESALVRVDLAGVCDTDLQIVKGYMGFRGTLGHEFVGTTIEGPDDLTGLRVVGEINFACGDCPLCDAGLPRHCPSRRVLGILDADGAFAEYVRVPVANLHTVPDSVPDDVAVFVEPLAAAFEILEQVDVAPGQDCVVLGDGKLGLLVAQVLASAGAEVLVVGRHPAKLAILEDRGVATASAETWRPEPSSMVVEATGTVEGLATALASVQPRGTLVLKSTVAETHAVDLAPLVINEISVVGSRCGPFPPALRALETSAVDVAPLISERVALRDGRRALDLAGRRGALKVLIETR